MTTTNIVATDNTERLIQRERIYVGVDAGYRQHVAAASPLSVFNAQRNPNAWRQVKTVRFGSDAAGFTPASAYLDKHTSTVTDLLDEPCLAPLMMRQHWDASGCLRQRLKFGCPSGIAVRMRGPEHLGYALGRSRCELLRSSKVFEQRTSGRGSCRTLEECLQLGKRGAVIC